MIKFSKISAIFFPFLLILLLPNAHSYGTHSLRGISGVAVFVENHSNDLSDKQIYMKQIGKTLEEKIEASEIEVYKQSQWMNMAGGGYIKLRIISSELNQKDSVAVYMNFEFYRTVNYLSNVLGQTQVSTAATWSTGKLMSCKLEKVYYCLYNGASDLADIFIRDYREINELEDNMEKKSKN